jgi:hypothetical protein
MDPRYLVLLQFDIVNIGNPDIEDSGHRPSRRLAQTRNGTENNDFSLADIQRRDDEYHVANVVITDTVPYCL